VGLKVFKNESGTGFDPGAWSEKLRAAMSFDTTESQDPMDNMAAGAPGIVAAVCVRDHWQEMSQEEKAWCVERVCSAVMEHANDWDRMARAQRFDMSPDRSCAWTVSSLLTKDLPESSRKRVEEAFAAALTHAIEEVRWYATWGVAELWPVRRDVASRSVYAIAAESSSVMTTMAVEDRKPYDERRPYEEITAEAAERIRKRFWEPDGLAADAYDKLDINDWLGAEAQNRILAILGKAPAERLATQAFTRAAQGLVQWWTTKQDRTSRRERNYEAEMSLAHLLEQFVMRASLVIADTVLQPILNTVNSHPRESTTSLKDLSALKIANQTQFSSGHSGRNSPIAQDTRRGSRTWMIGTLKATNSFLRYSSAPGGKRKHVIGAVWRVMRIICTHCSSNFRLPPPCSTHTSGSCTT
jgi:hypothetical protein